MDASRYKDYMLGLMFYKFLSDRTLDAFAKMNQETGDQFDLLEAYEKAYEQHGDGLTNYIQQMLGYYVSPEHLYQRWLKDINEGAFELQNVIDSLQTYECSVSTSSESVYFEGYIS